MEFVKNAKHQLLYKTVFVDYALQELSSIPKTQENARKNHFQLKKRNVMKNASTVGTGFV